MFFPAISLFSTVSLFEADDNSINTDDSVGAK